MQNNEFSHVRGAADSHGAHIDIACDSVIIQYNYSYNNEGGFAEILGDNINCGYRYNISVNDGYREDPNGVPWNKKGKIFLSGRNSQHKNLVEILGENLKMDVSLISPINSFNLKEFSYNPDEINQFSMSRVIGLGLTLLKENEIQEESLNNGFIIKSFLSEENSAKETKNSIFAEDKNLVKKFLPPDIVLVAIFFGQSLINIL